MSIIGVFIISRSRSFSIFITAYSRLMRLNCLSGTRTAIFRPFLSLMKRGILETVWVELILPHVVGDKRAVLAVDHRHLLHGGIDAAGCHLSACGL